MGIDSDLFFKSSKLASADLHSQLKRVQIYLADRIPSVVLPPLSKLTTPHTERGTEIVKTPAR